MKARGLLGDLTGSIADLGIFVPLTAALVLINGLSATSVLVCAGLLVIVSGVVFRIPFPVQPLKALTALAVALELPATTIHAAGLLLGALLLLASAPPLMKVITKIFDITVVRALQVGVGMLLVLAALRLAQDPPALFAATAPSSAVGLVLAIVAAGVIALLAERGHYSAILAGVAAATAFVVWRAGDVGAHLGASLPAFEIPGWPVFVTAFTTLVIPQIPLTIGNAVVATSDVAHTYFGERAIRVSPRLVCLSAGIANVVAAVAGGMPMCHGAGGLTAHYRLGARTVRMNLLLGIAFMLAGLVVANTIVDIFGLLPVWLLAAFLGYAGVRHALLVADRRGAQLAIALIWGSVGALTGNLAFTAAGAAISSHALPRFEDLSRLRPDGAPDPRG